MADTQHGIRRLPLNWRFLAATLAVTAVFFGVGLHRLEVDTDILAALPRNDPVISDAAYVLHNHPMQNHVAVDIALQTPDLETLVACGTRVEARLKESGLFQGVGMADIQGLMPELLEHVTANLPVLFSAEELQGRVLPMLRPHAIKSQLEQVQSSLLGLEGIGQEALIARDPLNLRGLVLSRMSQLAPAGGARIHHGHLVSADSRHLLLLASPAASSTDTEVAAAITALLNRLAEEANREFGQAGGPVTLTAVGAYRAALDNQRIIKKDIGLAVSLSTVGIAVLLFFAFCRPVVGLFSLLPSIAGTMLAYFVFSLFHESISIMVLGFGGAIISFSVDQGLAYLLFLDRPQPTYGREVSREVRGMGLLAMLTTVAAFGTLCFSSFPVFVQLGQFTMLGLGFCFLIVHTVFPRVFPVLPPGGEPSHHLQNAVDAIAGTGRRGLWAAAAFAAIMLFFAKPVFNVSLQAMNTVGADTLAAEERLTQVWGGIFNKVHLLTEGRTIGELQARGDAVLERIEADLRAGALSSGFVASMLFPGEALRQKNHAAWREFWDGGAAESVKREIQKVTGPLGFADEAFAAFYELTRATAPPAGETRLLQRYPAVLGLAQSADGSKWIHVSTLTTGPSYDAGAFYDAYRPLARLFDPQHFAESLGALLFDAAVTFFIINVVCAVILVALFTVDVPLTLACMAPLAFAFIGTLGTMKLMGHALDIPGLMLSIIVFGVGIDYSIFFVRSFQRYGTVRHPAFGRIRLIVFLSAATTLFGFGAMWLADHSVLKSTGVTAFLGVAYSMIGAFLILPPGLDRLERRRRAKMITAATVDERVRQRYATMEAYPRLFARFKTKFDPMFAELPRILQSVNGSRIILDIGSGYGVPACWLLERFSRARLYGIEPCAERVRVASIAVGERGAIRQGRAPELPDPGCPADLATMIDMTHFLAEDDLAATLAGLQACLQPGGLLVVRASVTPTQRSTWAWWCQNALLRLRGVPVHYRPADDLKKLMDDSGFLTEAPQPSGNHGELVWLVGRKA
ncbi:MAG: methyltransferase domain-containing protein [Desulfobacterales bacterium]